MREEREKKKDMILKGERYASEKREKDMILGWREMHEKREKDMMKERGSKRSA